jgi:hypothetical protein
VAIAVACAVSPIRGTDGSVTAIAVVGPDGPVPESPQDAANAARTINV